MGASDIKELEQLFNKLDPHKLCSLDADVKRLEEVQQ